MLARTMRRTAIALVAAFAVATTAGCVENPVGSASNGGIYASKASRSAESALSAVQTVRLVAGAASAGKVFGPYASISVDQQEDALTEITKLFRSIQPPDAASDALRAELGGLLDVSLEHLSAVRIEIRRGNL